MTDKNREVGRIIRRGMESGVLSMRGCSIHITLDCKSYDECLRWFEQLEKLCAPKWVDDDSTP